MTGNSISQKLTVSFDYPVVFTEGVFEPENPVLVDTLCRLQEKRLHRAVAIVDSDALFGSGLDAVRSYFMAHIDKIALIGSPLVVPGGEGIKNDWTMVRKMVRRLLDARLCRHSYVLAIGGGALLDAAGMAAALFHRGVRLVRLPTTVLSQNDAGIGVKNGVNFHHIKNCMGVFAPPFAVINDERFLATLPLREWISGIAEAFKVAIIRDRVFFDFLAANAAALKARDAAAMRYLIRRCAELHLEHMREHGDPFEMGRGRPLDFGHWSSHKIESMSGFTILHGEAVSMGMLLDCVYAVSQGWLAQADLEAIHRAVAAAGLPVWSDLMLSRRGNSFEIFGGIEEFREHLGGELSVSFPRRIGATVEADKIDLKAMGEALRQLRLMSPASLPSDSGLDQR